jgi:hypothetical protein
MAVPVAVRKCWAHWRTLNEHLEGYIRIATMEIKHTSKDHSSIKEVIYLLLAASVVYITEQSVRFEAPKHKTLSCFHWYVINRIFSLLSFKMKGAFIRSLICLYVPHSIVFAPYHWRWPRPHNFNPTVSTILIWRRFKLLTWMQNLHQSVLDYERLFGNHGNKTSAVCPTVGPQ